MKKIGICVLLVCLFLTACAGTPADGGNIETTSIPTREGEAETTAEPTADGGAGPTAEPTADEEAEITAEPTAIGESTDTYETERMLVRLFYENWKLYYERIWLYWPEGGEPNLEEGYYIVDDASLPDLDALKAQTEAIFTEECAQEHFYTPYLEEQQIYFEQDGLLCRQLAQFPGELTTIKDIRILEVSETEILAVIIQSGAEENPDDEEITMRLVLENEMYKIAEFSFNR